MGFPFAERKKVIMYLKKVNKKELENLIKSGKRIILKNEHLTLQMILNFMKKSKEIDVVDDFALDEKHYNVKISIRETNDSIELLDIRIDIAIEYGENPTTSEEYKELKKYCKEEILQCEEIVVLHL